MLYPQNGDRIVTIDSVTSLYHVYTNTDEQIEVSFWDMDSGGPEEPLIKCGSQMGQFRGISSGPVYTIGNIWHAVNIFNVVR